MSKTGKKSDNTIKLLRKTKNLVLLNGSDYLLKSQEP